MLNALVRRLRDHRGFSLIETLVAMVTGIVVVGALFGILEVSFRQNKHLSNVAQATQQGRGAMNRILEEVHSACIAENFAPVREGSTATKLILWDGYSKESSIPVPAKLAEGTKPAEGVFKDVVELKGENLIDTNYLSEKETANNTFSFKEPGSPVAIGHYIRAPEVTVAGKPTAKLFEYYEYAKTPTFKTSEASTTLKAMEVGTGTLTKEQAAKVAGVSVSLYAFPVEPIKEKKEEGDKVLLSSQATFAFSAPNSEAAIVAGPCE